MLFFKVVQDLQLGSYVYNTHSLHGGALHKMWFIETDKGQFALKEINPHITQRRSYPKSYEIAEKIASEFHQHGIPAVAAIKINHQFVHQIEDKWFIAYPYLKAKVIENNEITLSQTAKIGKIFADLHLLDLKIEGIDTAHYDVFSDEHWEKHIDCSHLPNLRSLEKILLNWNAKYHAAIESLNTTLVITHRDLHSINVLWDDDKTPYIIDWEASGLMNPLMEVIGYGIEWGGIIAGDFTKSKSQSLLQAYQQEINKTFAPHLIETAFYGWLGHCVMGWTEFNLRRMQGLTSKEPDEIKIGTRIIKEKMIPCLNYIANNENNLVELAIQSLS